MIFVECSPDLILVQTLRRVSRKDIVHELKGKGEVCKRLAANENCVAMLDEDPGSPQPPYIKSIRLRSDVVDQSIKVLHDNKRNNFVILLTPKLEDWILRATRLTGLNIVGYGLPSDSKELHRIINGKLDKYQDLLNDLSGKRSSMLVSLRTALETKL